MRKFVLIAFLFAACSPETAAPPPPASSSTEPAQTATSATTATTSTSATSTSATSTAATSTVATGTAATATPATSTAPQEKIERGAFIVFRDGKPLYREQFARSNRRFESDIAAAGANERVQQITDLNPDGTVRRTAVRTQGGATGQAMTILITGNKAAVEALDSKGAGGSKTVVVPPGTIPTPVPESLATLEQILRRARIVGQKTVQIAVLPGTLQPQRVFVTFTGPDSAQVEAASATILVKTDAEGRLLGGSEAKQRLTIRRE